MSEKRSAARQKAFLAAYKLTASVTKAADAAKVNRYTHYVWLDTDAEYGREFEKAKREAAQSLEDEAVRRAHEGVLVPVFWKGEARGVIREYSDGLMMLLLKGFLPDKYRERGAVEVSGAAGGPILLEDKRLAALTDDELASLVAVARKLAPGDSG